MIRTNVLDMDTELEDHGFRLTRRLVPVLERISYHDFSDFLENLHGSKLDNYSPLFRELKYFGGVDVFDGFRVESLYDALSEHKFYRSKDAEHDIGWETTIEDFSENYREGFDTGITFAYLYARNLPRIPDFKEGNNEHFNLFLQSQGKYSMQMAEMLIRKISVDENRKADKNDVEKFLAKNRKFFLGYAVGSRKGFFNYVRDYGRDVDILGDIYEKSNSQN